MVVVDVNIHSEHVQVIRCDFKPGLVERSTDLYKEVYLSSQLFKFPLTNKKSESLTVVVETFRRQ
jgi:SET domain-containing protein